MPPAECFGESSGVPPDGGQERSSTTTAVTAVVRSRGWTRVVCSGVLAASLWLSPVAVLAGETGKAVGPDSDTLAFGLTATQLAVAAAVGAGAGAAVAVASGNALTGLSLGFGTLGAIYVAHLAAEALVVGGIYYWWPWDSEDEAPAARTIAIKGASQHSDAIFVPLRVAPQR